MNFAGKLTHVRTYLSRYAVDALLLSSVENISYLSGFPSFSYREREAFLLITKKKAILFTNPLYFHEVKRQVSHLLLQEITREKPFTKHLMEIVSAQKIKKIGFESIDLSFAEFQRVEKIATFQPLSLDTLRMIKMSDEINNIEKACLLADKTFTTLLKEIKLGMSEKQIAWFIEKHLREMNAFISFDPIVAFNEHAAVPHHKPTDEKLKKSSVILLDFGAQVNGYCSDMSRTIFFGKPTKALKHMYQAVQSAQEQAISAITDALSKKQTVNFSDIDKKARDVIISQNFPTIPHALGHGIGLAVHEAPILSPFSKETGQNGMVFSIEPGIYLPAQGGVRIEDLFAIQGNKLKQLTHSPREIIVL